MPGLGSLAHESASLRLSKSAPMIRRIRARLAALLFGVVLAVTLAEVGIRLVLPRLGADQPQRSRLVNQVLPLAYPVDMIDFFLSGEGPVVFDDDLGWILTPDLDRSFGGQNYQHNHDRIRAEREYSRVPEPHVKRIAAYGDSFTYCWEVGIEDCWTTLLERSLTDTEVLNFGVPGYGPDQAGLRYLRDGVEWHPCAVLIGHMTENIDRVVNRFRGFLVPRDGPALPKPRYIFEDGQLQPLPASVERTEDLRNPAWVEANLGPSDAWYFPGIFVANPLDRLDVVRLVRTAAYRSGRMEGGQGWTLNWAIHMYRPGTEAFEILVGVLSRFADQVRSDGALPIVVVLPPRPEVIAERDGLPKPHTPLLAALDQRGIATIDVTDALGELARSSDVDDLIGVHYREVGNAAVARAIADRLPSLATGRCGELITGEARLSGISRG
jgi:hypothetical protein